MTTIRTKKPSECSESELDSFENLVRKGEAVTTTGLRDRIKKAQYLVFLFEKHNNLVGVAALKKPHNDYKRSVFEKASSLEDPNEYTFEAGWLCVEEQSQKRGYSRSLLEEVLKLAGDEQVYATTRENNKPMERTNARCGLQQSGHPYASEEGEYNLILYTRRPQQ